MKNKHPLLVFLLLLFLFSCAAPQADISATLVPSTVAPVETPTLIASTETAAPNLIPKSGDMIFVEFFAVT
jgi:hypothetical protein